MKKQITTLIYKKYTDDVLPAMQKSFKVKNLHALPKIEKIIVNMGIREAKDDKNIIGEAMKELAAIACQCPQVTKARKSISNFSLREGNPIGCRVTLRGKQMYEFLQKLLNVAVPRIRDFDGLKKSFDKYGNLNIGIKDETIFPEIEAEKIKNTKGMCITIVTDKKDREKSEMMFNLLGFPFVK